MDWQPGDHAVCVAECSSAGRFTWRPTVGATYTVADCGGGPEGPWLDLVEDPQPSDFWSWTAENFRKIRPDEHEPCEAEFTTLIKRAKQPETASDWLIRVGPIAKRLNRESLNDPKGCE